MRDPNESPDEETSPYLEPEQELPF
jgi:hypothetical protein